MHYDKSNTPFSIAHRISSFRHAFRGLYLLITREHNMWIHLFLAVLALMLGWVFSITKFEWLFLVLAIGLVFITEAINTALEVDINLTSPEYHPFARDVKDIAAGAVLIAVFFALIVGGLVFLPYFLKIF